MRYIVILLSLVFLSSCSGKTSQEIPFIIAHAGGSISGEYYLNSKEAVLQSVKRNLRYIELDLLQTTDGDLVAAHDWDTFHKLTGHKGETAPISSKQAKQRRILGHQTVLTSKEIQEIFNQYPQLYLVTDKIGNISLLREKFSSFLDRIIVELKSLEECENQSLNGIKQCVFLLDDPLPDTKAVVWVTLPLRKIDLYKQWLVNHPNVHVLVYTVNDKKIAKKLSKYPFIKGIYSDTLSPGFI